jgi:hypothetical protein
VPRGPKLVRISLASNRVAQVISFDPDIARAVQWSSN